MNLKFSNKTFSLAKSIQLKMCTVVDDLALNGTSFDRLREIVLMYTFFKKIVLVNRGSRSVAFKSGQKMALGAFYYINVHTKRSQRHHLAAIENN